MERAAKACEEPENPEATKIAIFQIFKSFPSQIPGSSKNRFFKMGMDQYL